MININKYILITVYIASACISTDSQIVEKLECNTIANSVHLNLRQLNIIDDRENLNSNSCYIVSLDTTGTDSTLSIHYCDLIMTKMKVKSFNTLLISKFVFEPNNSYVREEILYMFGHREGTIKYDLSINGNDVWLTGVTVLNGNQERSYILSEDNRYSLIDSYEKMILTNPLDRFLNQGQPPTIFRYEIVNNELHKVALMKNDSIVPKGKYNLALCSKYIDESENLFIAAFCSSIGTWCLD